MQSITISYIGKRRSIPAQSLRIILAGASHREPAARMFVPRTLAKVGLLVNGAVLLVFLAVINFSSILPEGAVAFEGAAPVGATLEVTETGLKLVSSGFLAAPGRLVAPLRSASFWTLMLVSSLIYILLLVNKREE